ncbi:MAG: hypothetical protein ACRCS8_05805 [Brevinema sp.]
MKKVLRLLLLMMIFFPVHSQNIVDLGLSSQELKNGILLLNDRKYAAAIQAFELALSYEPKNYAAKYRLGLAYLYAGYAQTAAKLWEELAKLGVADHQMLEQLNSLYFNLSKDSDYTYTDPYVFRKYYNGLTEGYHELIRSSFIIYDKIEDKKYISSTGLGQVVEMDSANQILQKYGRRLFRPNVLQMPTGIALHSNRLYIADYKKNKIYAFNRNFAKTLVFEFGETGHLPNQMLGPMGIVFSDDAYLYVVDNGNHRILKYLPDGQYISTFGTENLYRPTDIVSYGDELFVSDISKDGIGRVARFDHQGVFLGYIGEQFLKEPRGLFLDKNELYISDSQNSVYVYNITGKNSRALIANENKLARPFDIIKDKDSILWRTDFDSYNIAVYTPLQGIYGNISMNISQILTDQYPYIYASVRARSKDGSPLTGIVSDELKLQEFDMPIDDVVISGTERARSKMLTHLLIDRSLASEKFMPQLEYYLKTFLSNNTGQDLIQVTLVDDKTYKSDRMPASVSRIWDFVTNQIPTSSVPAIWDQPIYDGITSLLNNLRNRSLIVFTSGAGANDAFTTYGADIIKTYADQNSIPIYVVNFSNINREFWSKIAQQSHGQYYHAVNDAQDILNLYTTIKQSPPLEYLIEFDAHNYSDAPGLWVDLTIHLDRFGVNGTTTSGYYVPERRRRKVDLEKALF